MRARRSERRLLVQSPRSGPGCSLAQRPRGFPDVVHVSLSLSLSRNKHLATRMSAIDSIINYTRKEDEDFYALLGCDESATVEQITTEFKVRALQYHPDKNDGNKEAEAMFQKLNEAKETLCDPEKRSNYDKWRNSGISISYKQWLGMKEHVHQSMHWSTFKTKDRMLPETGEGGGSAPAAHRRASEGGANIHWGARGTVNWQSDASSEVVSKFRNYEI